MVSNYSSLKSYVLSFFKLTLICSSDKFAFLFLNSRIYLKSVSNSPQICFKFFLNGFKICYLTFFKKFASTRFRKLLTPFSSFRFRFISELICLKLKRSFEKIPKDLILLDFFKEIL